MAAGEPQKPVTDRMQNLIRARIEASGAGFIHVENEQIYAHQALPVFYEKRGFLPAWAAADRSFPFADELLRGLQAVSSDGLRPEDYHLERISSYLKLFRQPDLKSGLNIEALVDLDLLMTDAFLVCGAHMIKGRINPESIDPEWFAILREIDMPQVIEKAIKSQRISETLLQLRPEHQEYYLLVTALEKYREIARQGGWESVPKGSSLKPGETNPRIPLIRKRLFITGDLENEQPEADNYFDDSLQDAVIHFQNRHGLDADGIVGPETFSEMNTPIEMRIESILLNLERWRWLPQKLGQTHIIVNIADYTLAVREHDVTVLEMRAIVGRPFRRTPVFSDKITYLVINPSWNIPQKLAIHDILPAVQKNPDYLADMKISVLKGWGANSQFIDSNSVTWAAISPQHFPYHFRQEPGPKNALGRFKFMFPNKFNVYIHDTPSRDLFQKTSRSFSSGCIRIEQPLLLAQYLLADNPTWASDKITLSVSAGVEQTVNLPNPVPVHLLYWTVWATPDGIVHFRKDIYGRDERLLKALSLPAPENKKE